MASPGASPGLNGAGGGSFGADFVASDEDFDMNVMDFEDSPVGGEGAVLPGQEEQEQAKRRKPATIPIVAVIVAAMFISCGASVVGGLVMYFESLKALESTVEETSEAELINLGNEINKIVLGTVTDADTMINQLYSAETISTNDEREWANVVRNVAWATIRAKPMIYSLGIVLIPRDGRENDACYLSVWVDPLRNGSAELSVGLRHRPHTSNVTYDATAKAWMMDTPSYSLNRGTGAVGSYLYGWNSGSYLSWIGSYNPDNDTALKPEDGYGFEPVPDDPINRVHRILGKRHRENSAWTSPDNTLYAYAGWDVIYDVPPPPHPWSDYKAVNAIALYLYQFWEPPLRAYRDLKGADTTVVVLDRKKLDIYASTTENRMLDQVCFDNWDGKGHGPSKCSTKLHNMSASVQDAWDGIKDSERDFRVMDAGGSTHFVRKMVLFEDVVLLWVRPTSSVQDKVNAALYLLVIFTCVVFCFDLVVGIFQILLVASPIKKVSKALVSVGKMEIGDAEETLDPLMKKQVMIGEVHKLLDGVHDTMANLLEFRSYLPEASLQQAESQTPAPTGTIALAFSDIVGSTPLWENAPEEMAEGLDIHNKVLRNALRRHNGYEVKTIGDAFMVAFQNPQDAYEYGVEVQAELVTQCWPPDLCMFHNTRCEEGEQKQVMFAGIRIRMGIHYGPVEQEVNPLTGRSDYRGATVNKAARIEPQALHGMTAFSEELKNAVSATLPVSVLGNRDLKGIGTITLYYSNPRAISSREKRFRDQIDIIAKGGNPYAPPTRTTSELKLKRGGSAARSECSSAKKSRPSRESTVILMKKERLARGGAAHLNLNLKKEHGAICILQMDTVTEASIQSAASDTEIRVILRVVNSCLQIALEAGSMTDGKVESCIGAQAIMSWGLSSRVSGSAKQCLRFVGHLYRRRAGQVTAGAVIGPFVHGNVGTASRRYHTVLGVGYEYARMLPALCRQHNTPHLVIMAGGLPPALGHACIPIDIMHGDQDYGPYVVLEMPDTRLCAQLEMTWDDGEAADAEDVMNPVVVFRSKLLEAAYAKKPLDPALVPTDRLPQDLATLVSRFTERGEQLAQGLLDPSAEMMEHKEMSLTISSHNPGGASAGNGGMLRGGVQADGEPLSPNFDVNMKDPPTRAPSTLHSPQSTHGMRSMLNGGGFTSGYSFELTGAMYRGKSWKSSVSSRYRLKPGERGVSEARLMPNTANSDAASIDFASPGSSPRPMERITVDSAGGPTQQVRPSP